jgi:hypothetical protein
MSSVVTTRAGKGSALTNNELDANFAPSWHCIKLATDCVNATTTPATISDGAAGATNIFTYTPAANTDFEIEVELLVQAVTTANLPLISVAVPAGYQYGTVEIIHQSTATGYVNNMLGFTTTAVTPTMVAGTAVSATVPFRVQILIKGRAGATPSAITIRGAGETAAAAACTVKAGSVMRYRTIT